jgi:hypothetical protein
MNDTTEAEMIAAMDEEDRNWFGLLKTAIVTLKSAYLIYSTLKATVAWHG